MMKKGMNAVMNEWWRNNYALKIVMVEGIIFLHHIVMLIWKVH